jgi:hypothetical protein
MRQLSKKAWPYKTRISPENFDYEEHHKFVERYPAIKIYVIERNSNWSDYKLPYRYDVYFKKESDLVFYRLRVQ